MHANFQWTIIHFYEHWFSKFRPFKLKREFHLSQREPNCLVLLECMVDVAMLVFLCLIFGYVAWIAFPRLIVFGWLAGMQIHTQQFESSKFDLRWNADTISAEKCTSPLAHFAIASFNHFFSIFRCWFCCCVPASIWNCGCWSQTVISRLNCLAHFAIVVFDLLTQVLCLLLKSQLNLTLLYVWTYWTLSFFIKKRRKHACTKLKSMITFLQNLFSSMVSTVFFSPILDDDRWCCFCCCYFINVVSTKTHRNCEYCHEHWLISFVWPSSVNQIVQLINSANHREKFPIVQSMCITSY